MTPAWKPQSLNHWTYICLSFKDTHVYMKISKETLECTGHPTLMGGTHTLEVGGGGEEHLGHRGKSPQVLECSAEGKMQTDLGSYLRPDVRWGHLWSHVPPTQQPRPAPSPLL